jgi:hypothetical protein
MNEWTFKNKKFELDVNSKAFGFVYLITELSTNKLYIGQKQFYSKKNKAINGKKKSIKIESDWKSYFSSSEYIKEQIKNNNLNFKREILVITSGKGQSNYIEAKLQMDFRVLENPDFLNGIINLRCSKSHVKLDTIIDSDSYLIDKLFKKYHDTKLTILKWNEQTQDDGVFFSRT